MGTKRAGGQGGSTQELLARAQAAEEAYDYEQALTLLREAASVGELVAVHALARFLVESYGQYEEAAALLARHEALVSREPSLVRLRAEALFHTSDRAAARAHYEQLVTHRAFADEALWWTRLGLLREELGEPAPALLAFRTALAADPTDHTARERGEQIAALLQDASAELVREAREAFDEGELVEARRRLQAALDSPAPSPEATRLLREIEARERDRELEGLLAAASAAETRGELDEALSLWRSAAQLDPTCAGAHEAAGRLEQQIALLRFEERIARGRQALAEGRAEEAVHAFYRAHSVRPTGLDTAATTEDLPLFRLTVDFVEQMGARHLERAAGALVALCRAEEALAADEGARAEELVRGAAATLSGFGPVEALRARLQAEAEHRRHAAARADYEAALALEASDPEAALPRFERLLREHGGDFADAARRAAQLRESLRRQEDARRQRENLVQLAAKEAWFELRREWREAPAEIREDEALAALADSAQAALDAAYPAHLSPPPWVDDEVRSRELDSRATGLPDLDPERTRLVFDSDGTRALVLSGPLLVGVDLTRLTPWVLADLSPALSFGEAGQLVMGGRHPAGGARVAVFDEESAQLLLLRVDERQVEAEDRLDLSHVIPARRKESLRYYALHEDSGRLVQLETRRDSNGPSTLRNLDLASGRVVHEERFNYGLWNLRRDPDTEDFLVNRVFDPRMRRHPSYFVFAVMNHRGRLLRRYNPSFQDLPEPIERIVSVARSARLERTYVTYDYLDALGNSVRGRPALLVLQGDSEVFYQSPAPEKLLTGRRLPRGTVRVLEGPGAEPLLVIPYTDADGHVGLTVLDAASLEHRFDADLEPEERLVALRATPAGDGLVAFTFPYGDGGWRLRRLDVGKRGWA